MCRPTKRPRPLVAAATVAPAVEQTAAAPVESDAAFKDELATFVFDLKGDDMMSFNQMWQKESPLPEIAVNLPETIASFDSFDADKPKTFVYTTFDMVNELKNSSAIGFNLEGDVIEIRDLDLLADKILPVYFRHRNVTSFYRQLNSYGFRTTRSVTPNVVHAFSHELFRRDRPDLLCNIIRKKCAKRSGMKDASNEESSCKNEIKNSPSSPISMSSSSSITTNDDSSSQSSNAPVLKRKVAAVAPRMTEAAKNAQRAAALEAHNKAMLEENRAMLVESETILRSMNNLVDIQTSLIEKLFGVEASIAFADQARPFRMGAENLSSVMKSEPSSVEIQTAARDYNDFEADTSAMLFADDELAILEDILINDSAQLVL